MTDAQARNLGLLIHNARIAKGLSFRALAAITDVPLASLKRFEDGVYNDPSPAQIARIAEALDIDPARIDRVSKNHLADSMPTMRTYLRSKEKLSPEAMDALEQALADIRAEDAARRAGASPAPRKTGGTP
jgi:transcriptional regulator with XRE-family HTH domain